MRRAPAKPVPACTLRNWCLVSHVTFEAPLRTSRFTLHTSHSTLHTAPFAVNTSHFTVHTSHFTLHTSHSTLHTSHSALHTSQCLSYQEFENIYRRHRNSRQLPAKSSQAATVSPIQLSQSNCQRFKKRIELRTQTQPLVAEHRGGTNSRMKRPQPHPPHTRGTLHRRLQPLYTEKHKVSCSGFLPTR